MPKAAVCEVGELTLPAKIGRWSHRTGCREAATRAVRYARHADNEKLARGGVLWKGFTEFAYLAAASKV